MAKREIERPIPQRQNQSRPNDKFGKPALSQKLENQAATFLTPGTQFQPESLKHLAWLNQHTQDTKTNQAILDLQASYGNQYVQRLVSEATTRTTRKQKTQDQTTDQSDLSRWKIQAPLDTDTLARKGKSKGTVTIGKTEVTYFEVEGDNLQAVGEALGTEEWGRCGWDFSETGFESTEGTVDVVNVKLTLKIELPRWTGDGWKKASPATRKEWNRMLKALKKHENGHASRAKKFAPKLKKLLLGKAEGEFQSTMDEAIAAHKTDVQDAYDSETESGQKQGVSLNPNIDGSAKESE